MAKALPVTLVTGNIERDQELRPGANKRRGVDLERWTKLAILDHPGWPNATGHHSAGQVLGQRLP
jgi:hypothetical protein